MKKFLTASLVVAVVAGAGVAFASSDQNIDDDGSDHAPVIIRLIMPNLDVNLGRELFASKGCVACHSVNGVGGDGASPLDAHDMDPYMNPFDLAARMWRMAPYMIAAQEEALGAQIQFSGDELSSIIAFLHNDAAQHQFTEDKLSPEVLALMDHAHGAMTGEVAHAVELEHTEGE
ncbi:MAG: c-type cytochrome [Paracoccaceae bacterium]